MAPPAWVFSVLPSLSTGPTVALLYPLLLGCLGMVLLAVSYWVWTNERGPAGYAYIAVLVSSTIWSVGMAAQVLVPSLEGKIVIYQLWASVSWLIGIGWFVFVVYYTGRKHWFTRWTKIALVGFSAIPVTLTLTNTTHHLIWSGYAIRTEGLPFPVLVAEPTALYYVLLSITYLLVVVGLGILFKVLLTARHATASQTVSLLLGSLAVLAVNLGYNAVMPRNYPELNPTPVGLAVLFLLSAWALFRHQLFAIEPLARDTVVEEITDAVLIVDMDGRIVDYNERALTFFPAIEGSFGDALSEHCPSLLAEDAEDDFVSTTTVTVGGEQRILSVSPSPLHIGETTRAHALIARDVTEVKKYTRELERQTEQLDRFASTVSHDLRNPLTVADGHVELAQETGDTSQLWKAREAHKRMERIIEDVLTLAREGQVISEREPVSLSAVAGGAWETADTGSLILDVDLTEPVAVSADEDRLRTIFENLFRNVADHAEGATTVRLGLSAIEAADERHGGQVAFFVEDDGPGIPEAQREDVFEYGHTTSDDGTGLGLSTVATIAEAHDWEVSVTTGHDGGCRFVFENVTLADQDDEEHARPVLDVTT